MTSTLKGLHQNGAAYRPTVHGFMDLNTTPFKVEDVFGVFTPRAGLFPSCRLGIERCVKENALAFPSTVDIVIARR